MVEETRSLLYFEGVKQPIRFINCDELHPLLKSIFRDSQIELVSSYSGEDTSIIIERTVQGYERSSLWLDKPAVFKDPVDAVCDLTVDLIHAFVGDHQGCLCLHSAAALFNQGLFLFPSTYRSGKSTLSLHLAFNKVPLFTDDALPVIAETNEGMATGLFPRLRLPLPESVTPAFRDYVRQRIALRNDRYCYVSQDGNEQPQLGSLATIKGIVLLDLCTDNKETVLTEAGRKEVIKEMILRNFARQNKALDIVERIYTIVERAECYKLTYSDPNLAAACLINAFNE